MTSSSPRRGSSKGRSKPTPVLPATSPIAGELTWSSTVDHHTLKVTGADLDKVSRSYLSPSSAASLNRCPAGLAVDRLCTDVDESVFDPAPLGTRAHSVLEDLFQLPHYDRTKRTARTLVTKHVEVETHLSRIERHFLLSATWRRVRGLWLIEDPTKVQVRRTEWSLNNFPIPTPHGLVPFTGIIDRVDISGGETTVGCSPIDYKAGAGKVFIPRNGTTDDKADQIRIYAAALEAFDGRLPVKGSLYFTYHGKERSVSLQRAKVDETLDRFGKAWHVAQDVYSTGVFPAHPNKLCNYCPAARVCPARAASEAGQAVMAPPAAVAVASSNKISLLDLDFDEM
jgi:putative RecB family exonuclease